MSDDGDARGAMEGVYCEVEEVAAVEVRKELGATGHKQQHGLRVTSLSSDVQRRVLSS